MVARRSKKSIIDHDIFKGQNYMQNLIVDVDEIDKPFQNNENNLLPACMSYLIQNIPFNKNNQRLVILAMFYF